MKVNLSASQDIPSLLWKLEVHCSVQKRRPLNPILSRMNPVHHSHLISLRSFSFLFNIYSLFSRVISSVHVFRPESRGLTLDQTVKVRVTGREGP